MTAAVFVRFIPILNWHSKIRTAVLVRHDKCVLSELLFEVIRVVEIRSVIGSWALDKRDKMYELVLSRLHCD